MSVEINQDDTVKDGKGVMLNLCLFILVKITINWETYLSSFWFSYRYRFVKEDDE